MTEKETKKIDENLYSRQLYVLGHDAMARMQNSNVLIIGLNGVGVEIAKNVILTGVNSVTLHDNKNVSKMDLASQFFLSEEDVGKNRAECSLPHLKELNEYVQVDIYKGEINKEYLENSNFTCVVVCDAHITDLVELNEICHKKNIKFIAAESRGLCGMVFCDFGRDFEVTDPDGEPPQSAIVVGITNDNPGVVTVHDDKRHGLYTGDYVVFEGIEGMEELNNQKPMQITVTGPYTFTICDTTKFGKYTSGGFVKQVKQTQKFSYDPLKDALENPKFLETDFSKIGRPAELHVAFQALGEYAKTYKELPRPYNKDDAEKFLSIAKKYAKEQLNEDIIRKFAYTSRGDLNPIAAFIGGVAAQEVQKACSGKFTPLNNFLYFDAFEALGETLPEENDCQPIDSRYDGQIVVFGKKFQEKLLNQKSFIVGVGALGCEFLKNFALVGLCCGEGGKLTITDMDAIETSNLNRQFLFRKRHIGKPKSVIGAEIAKTMNKDLKVIALQDKVAPETEDVFDDDFWEELDFVTNALDNIQARLYTDARCVYYRKPLMESGTLGTKGNVQVVIPHITESYGASRDPPEKDIPICTLKNFPNAIEHCIQYARDLFEGLFKQMPEDVNAYLSRPDFIDQLESQGVNKLNVLNNIHEALVTSKPNSFDECVVWARLKFEQLFNNQIKQLLYNFPIDMKTSTGTPFWGGAKRPPTPIDFDANDPTHMQFIKSAAILHAENYGLKPPSKDYDFKKVVESVQVPKFVPKEGVKIATTTEEEKEQSEQSFSDDDQKAKEIIKELPKPSDLSGYRLNPINFEKDDDTNFHIDFITAASNLRARNYKIPEADKHKTKGIAGKIIPAMVTTTALVTGLVGIEIYKIVQGLKKIELYRNSFANIALPFITQSEPVPPAAVKYGDTEWTQWDRFDIDLGRDISLKEFLDYFQKKHKLEITMMSSGSAVIYSFFSPKDKLQKRLPMPVSEVVKEILKTDFLPKQKYLNFEICCMDENGEDVDVPYVRYKFRFFDKK